jgi:hypothetical protein
MPPSFPLTPTSSDGDPFCTQEFCDYEDIYRTRFFQLNTDGGGYAISGDPARDFTESILDTDGAVYAPHFWYDFNTSLGCLGPVVTKVSNSSVNASVVWTKQYKCNDGLFMRNQQARIKLDIYGNLWVIYATSTANGTVSTPQTNDSGLYDYNVHFLRISKSTGNLLFHKSFKTIVFATGSLHNGIETVVHDPYGNWYIGSTHAIGDSTWNPRFNSSDPSDPANTFARTGWVIKLNYALDVQWGFRWAGGARYDITELTHMVYVPNALYIATRSNESRGSIPTFLKLNTNTGTLSAFNGLDYEAEIPTLRVTHHCIAADSFGNLYAVPWLTFNTNRFLHIIKLSPTGSTIWTKKITVDDIAPDSFEFNEGIITISAGNRIFISGARGILPPGSNTRAWRYIIEITTSGEVVSTRRYRNENAPFNVLWSMHTYTYSPNTLFLKFRGGDHVDTTMDVEEFSIPERTMLSIPSVQSTEFTPAFRISSSVNNTWGSVHSDFVASSTSFTVTPPDFPTQLYDVAKIRD